MRDIVIKEIIDTAEVNGITSLEYYHVKEITKEELSLCSDEDLVDMLIYVCTYDEES